MAIEPTTMLTVRCGAGAPRRNCNLNYLALIRLVKYEELFCHCMHLAKLLWYKNKDAAAKRLIINGLVVGSIPIRGNKVFSFVGSGNRTNCNFEFRHSTRNAWKIEWKYGNVLTLAS